MEPRRARNDRKSAIKQRELRRRAHYGQCHDVAVRATTDLLPGLVKSCDRPDRMVKVEVKKAVEEVARLGDATHKTDIKTEPASYVATNNYEALLHEVKLPRMPMLRAKCPFCGDTALAREAANEQPDLTAQCLHAQVVLSFVSAVCLGFEPPALGWYLLFQDGRERRIVGFAAHVRAARDRRDSLSFPRKAKIAEAA